MSKTLPRRHFLRGAAGFSLALPFMSSLQPKAAKAQSFQQTPRFVAFGTHHGGIWGQNMFPTDASLTNPMSYRGHEIRSGALNAAVNGSTASISSVLSADASVLTPAIAAKMNVIRGLDVAFYIGHHTGGHLGNYARNDANGGDGGTVGAMPRATIDQAMAWSPSFYGDLSTTLVRAMTIGSGRLSYVWSSPQSKSGTIQEATAETSSLALFNQIFVPDEDPEVEERPHIVDRVLEDYQRLRQSNRRLSSDDRQRLDDHLERLDELERKLNVQVSCSDVVQPTADSEDYHGGDYSINPAKQRDSWRLFNDVIVAAFMCGTSRIATVNIGNTFSAFSGDWHQDIAHQAHLPDGSAQQVIADAHQRFFEDIYMDLVYKLEEREEYPGQTLLDSALVQWTQESGAYTHDSISVPVITAGSAAGRMQTGNYIDYRNLNRVANGGGADSNEVTHTGLSYNQYLATAMQVMGVPANEFEEPGVGGYGVHFPSTEGWYGGYQNYDAPVFQNMSELLPYLGT